MVTAGDGLGAVRFGYPCAAGHWPHRALRRRLGQGFLVESIAVEEAANITRFGGWRRYMASLSNGGTVLGGAVA